MTTISTHWLHKSVSHIALTCCLQKYVEHSSLQSATPCLQKYVKHSSLQCVIYC